MTQATHRDASREKGQPTFVFVHGAGSNSFSWAPLLRELTLLGHRTLAVDLPGHGFDAQFPISYQAPRTWRRSPTSRRRWRASASRTTWTTSSTSCGASPCTGRSSWSVSAWAG
ncbi:alpha/beta fold hydrolase [Cystobacter fuscus]